MKTGSSDHVQYMSHYIQYFFVFLLKLAFDHCFILLSCLYYDI